MRVPALLLAVLVAGPAAAADSGAGGAGTGEAGTGDAASGWQCAATTATAYRFDPREDRWKTLVFAVDHQRYVVAPAAGPAGLSGHVRWELRAETTGRVFACHEAHSEPVLHCGPDGEFRMDRRRLTFSSHLFVNESVPDGAQAVTSTGRCQPSRAPAPQERL